MGNRKAKGAKFFSADQILAVDDLKRETVHVPEWGCSVIVAAMSGEQRDAFELSIPQEKDIQKRLKNLRARIVVATCVKEDGSPLFTFDQVDALGRKSGTALDRIANVAKRLNKISAADEEELVKN